MNEKIEQLKKDLDSLIKDGENLKNILKGNDSDLLIFRENYEIWYSESFYLIKNLLNSRLEDFQSYYDSKKDCLKKSITYTPNKSDFFGINDGRYNQADLAKSLFINQLNILKSVYKKFESSLFDIKELLHIDLLDSEIEIANELNKKGFYRASGAILGVVLEGHLKKICINRNILPLKKNPVINDFSKSLKDNNFIETPEWRKIMHLSDLRNLCDHKKDKDPTKEDIEDLSKGVQKIIKTVF